MLISERRENFETTYPIDWLIWFTSRQGRMASRQGLVDSHGILLSS